MRLWVPYKAVEGTPARALVACLRNHLDEYFTSFAPHRYDVATWIAQNFRVAAVEVLHIDGNEEQMALPSRIGVVQYVDWP